MWNIPVSLIAGGSDTLTTITSDTLIGNLWNFLGSPSGPQVVIFTIDGADAGNIQITADWTAGTTFQINCINGGRIVGLGGDGGNGATDFGSFTQAGFPGDDGGHALTSDSFTVNVDIDDGFLLGGGGGGGGGAGEDLGASSNSGGGGGGGAGFSVTIGGDAGVSIGAPPSLDGDDGGPSGPGAGGDGVTSATDGGAGGTWGEGGITGDSTALGLRGGVGGRSGSAFLPTNSGSINYNGAKSEATLISESRILGQQTAGYVILETISFNVGGGSGSPSTIGFTFQLDGDRRHTDSFNGDTVSTNFWFGGAGDPAPVAADFEIRTVAGHSYGEIYTGTADGTWTSLSTSQSWEYNDTGPSDAWALVEIRAAGSAGILDSGYIHAENSGP